MAIQQIRPDYLYLLLIVCQFTSAGSAPVDHSTSEHVRISCVTDPAASLLKYSEGQVYHYEFEAAAITRLEGISTETTRFDLHVLAALVPESGCRYVMIVKEVSLGSGQVSSTKVQELQDTFIRFGYQDGVLDEHVEVAEADTVWSVNIKRALVSLFNNAALAAGSRNATELVTSENDVSGSQCPTSYMITNGNGNGGAQFQKTRDLNRCGSRDGGWSVSQGVPYSSGQEFLSDTLVQSLQTCQQDFPDGILQSAWCEETHKLQLLTSDTSGAVTTVKSTITFRNQEPGGAEMAATLTRNVPIKSAKIYFDHTESQLQSDAISKAAVECSELSPTEGSTFTPTTGGIFLDLQAAASSASSEVLRTVYDSLDREKQADSCGGAAGHAKRRQLYLDAVASTGRSDSIVFLLKLMQDNVDLPSGTEQLLYLNMAFADKPGESALKAASDHLVWDPKNIKLVLASSGLAHQFCSDRSKPRCTSNEHYVKLVNLFANVAQAHCFTPQDVSIRVQYAITALQALGNLDALTPQAVTAIHGCITDPRAGDRIKLQALQAFRRDPCQGKLKKAAASVLLNSQLGSDLRIHAYLALTRCLSFEDVRAIRRIVETEEVEQVKSLISLHRANMLYSSKPAITQEERDLYKNIGENWADEPNFDSRKYSTFFETTNYDEDEDSGYSADTNLIYSQNSFVPRTISSNFSVYYVGRAYNLLEIGANLADFENYFENLFGASQAEPLIRPLARNTASGQPRYESFDHDEYERFRNKVIMPKFPPGSGPPVSDVYIRVFGTTIFSESVTADDVLAAASSPSPFSFLRNKLRSVFGPASLNFAQQIPLLSDELKIPTISGFPIHLQFKSTAIASLDWSSDIRGRGDWGRIVTSLAPSVTIFTRGKMSIGTASGPVNENGVQFEMKVHQSGAIEIKSEFSQEKGPGSFSYNASIKLPSDRITFLEAANEVHWISKLDGGVGDGVLSKTTVNTKFSTLVNRNECSAKIGQYLGLQLCANVNLLGFQPRPRATSDEETQVGMGARLQPFLLGSNLVSAFLEKTDAKLEEFVLQVKYEKSGTSAGSLTLLLDSPNSVVNRKIDVTGSFQFTGDGAHLSALDVRIDTPWKNIRVSEQITRKSDTEKHDTFVVTIDGKDYVVTQESSWSTEKVSEQKLTAIGKLLLTYKPPDDGGGGGAKGGRLELLRFEGTRQFDLGSAHNEMGTFNEVRTTVKVETNVPLIQLKGKLSGCVIHSSLDLESQPTTDMSEYTRFYQRTHAPAVSYEFQDVAVSSTWGHLSLNGTLRRAPERLADLTLHYGRSSIEENSLSLYTENTGRVERNFAATLRLASTQIQILNLDGKWSSAIDHDDEKYVLGLEFVHRPKDDDERLSFVLNAGHTRLFDGRNTKIDLQVLTPSKSVDLQVKAGAVTTSAKRSADFGLKFGSIVDSATKLEIDKTDISYELKSKHVINEKTIILESSYGDRSWKGLVHLQPENFYIDLTGTFDRRPNNYYNVDNIKVTLNTSALAASQLLVLSYELESRETLASLQKVVLDLKYGQDELGRFLFQKKLEGVQLEAFAYKLLETQFKAGLNPTARNEFSLTFHGEWFPTKSVVNTALVARSQKAAKTTKPPGPESVEVILKLDNGRPTYFYELRSLTLFNATFVNSTNDVTIHGAKSTVGIKHFRRNQELRDKPSLELSFLSGAGNKYRAMISTGTKTVFAPDNVHLLYDIDLVVDLPNRAPIHVQYLVELQKQSLESEIQRFVLNTNYEAKYQDPEYPDSRYGLSFETKLSMTSWNPVIVLQVHTYKVDYKLDLAIRQSPKELVKLNYGSTTSKTGFTSKLHDFDFNVVHETTTRFPREMNRLTVQTRFQNHIEKTSGNADFKYKYKFVPSQVGFPVQNLEVQETGVASFTRGNNPVFSFKSNKVVRLAKEEFYMKYEDLLDDAAYSLLGPNFELQVTRSESQKKRFALLLQVSNGKVFRLDESPTEQERVLLFGQVEVLRPDPRIAVEELTIYFSQTFSTTFYKTSSLVIRQDHSRERDGMYETNVRATGDAKAAQVNNLLDLFELSNDLTVRVSQGDPKRLYIAYLGNNEGRHLLAWAKDPSPTFEMNLQWGASANQNLTAVATLARADSSLKFVLESPALAGGRWTVQLTGPDPRRGGESQAFSVVAESPESKQIIKFEAALTRNPRSATKQLTCSYDITLKGYFDGPRSGKLEAELTQTSPTRQKFSFTLEDNKNGALSSNVSLHAKSHDGEHAITASVCGSQSRGDLCDSLEAFLNKLVMAGQEKYKFHIIGERSGLKTGISFDQAEKRTEIWYPSKAKKQQHIGIRPVIKQEADGSDLYYVKSEIVTAPDEARKSGLEITLTERTILLAFVHAMWENKQADADAYEIGIWLDQKRKPEERIGVGLANIGASVQEVDQGRSFVMQFGHPEILKKYQRNLKISTKYRYGIGERIFNVLIEFDIFKRPEDKFTLQAELNHKVEEDGGTTFAIYLNADSTGQQLGFRTRCADIKQQLDVKAADCHFQIRSREKGERKFRLKYLFEGDSKHLEFGRTGDGSQRYLHYNQTKGAPISVRDPFTGENREFPISKTEIQLLGMVDHRVNEQTYNQDPFGYSMRTYPSFDPPGQYTEFWVGKLTAIEYGIGYARVEDGGRRNIFQVSNPRKGLLVFTLRFIWDKATIKNVLTKFQSRVTATAGEMSRFVSSNENEIGASFSRVWRSVTSSMPDPQSLNEWDLNELRAIMEEQSVPDEVVAYITSNLEGASELIFSTSSNELDPRAAGHLNLRQGFAARIVAYGEFINGVTEGVKLALDKDFDPSSFYSGGDDSEDNELALSAPLTSLSNKFKAVSAIRDSILELESRHAILKKIVTSLKRAMLKRFQTLYKGNVDDMRNMFPYPETERFLPSLRTYVEKRLLGNDNDTAIRDDFANKLQLALQRIFSETLQLDMKNGVFQFSIPEITRAKLIRKLLRANGGERAPPGILFKFWANLLLSREEALPPIDGKGLILGSSYFQTFDRVVRRFESTCQYLLASDFVGNNFTVAIDLRLENNRATMPTRSIIFTNGQDTMVLTKDDIFFNGAQVPWHPIMESMNLGPFVVHFKFNGDWRIIQGNMGVVVGCSLKMDLCIVRVSGFYFGRLRGVLGNFNNEGYDDFVVPTGTTTESSEAFVRAWKINAACRTQTISKYMPDLQNYVQLAKTFPASLPEEL